MTFTLVVKGLWMGLIFLFILLFANSILPGQITESTFTDIGIFSIFALLVAESIFSFGGHD